MARMRWPQRDAGAASIYALGVGMLLVLLAMAVAWCSTALVDGARARSAADLAALAAAARAGLGQDGACAMAAEAVARNHAELVACALDGLDVTLTVRVGQATRTARAGPIRTPVGSP